METIYDWLLHNTGNTGNYYTILNTQRDESDGLDVMVRSADFKVVNLLIHDAQNSDFSGGKSLENSYVFGDEQQVISFLIDGKTPESQPDKNTAGISVLVTEPAGEAGDVTFPPAQS
ncbi:hypothetical protein [Spirosoma validum]|uniref:Uncharacterized protein n=1 Tax=Spirosoma validum TaxID=2771355 RepID=A0A927B8H2_9BACT|nr:hypothetical protein [Spirosoma validum]MBD2757213.1 hypothetical protein [Spirosoma validum]